MEGNKLSSRIGGGQGSGLERENLAEIDFESSKDKMERFSFILISTEYTGDVFPNGIGNKGPLIKP
jgi:hypothetical protein